jgi:hypothetical protein
MGCTLSGGAAACVSWRKRVNHGTNVAALALYGTRRRDRAFALSARAEQGRALPWAVATAAVLIGTFERILHEQAAAAPNRLRRLPSRKEKEALNLWGQE